MVSEYLEDTHELRQATHARQLQEPRKRREPRDAWKPCELIRTARVVPEDRVDKLRRQAGEEVKNKKRREVPAADLRQIRHGVSVLVVVAREKAEHHIRDEADVHDNSYHDVEDEIWLPPTGPVIDAWASLEKRSTHRGRGRQNRTIRTYLLRQFWIILTIFHE